MNSSIYLNNIKSPSLRFSNGDVIFTDKVLHYPSGAGGISEEYVVNITTTSSTPTILFAIPTSSGGASGTTYTIKSLISLGDATGGANTGSYSFLFKAKNILGTVSVSDFVNVISILDGTLTDTSVSASVSGSNIRINVEGLTSTTINWIGKIEIISQEF